MEMITWSEKYSVNNFLLDSQHKKLISIINMLHSSMKEGKSKGILEQTIDSLINYTQEHFRTEERMMQRVNYQGFSEHKKLHETLTQQVLEFQKKYKENKALISIDIMNFLRDWLINHIEGTDKKYKDKLS